MLDHWLRRISRKFARRTRRLCIEALEDRRMLAMADIVFLVDESSSVATAAVQIENWLSSIIGQLDSTLRSQDNTDVQYGLVGEFRNHAARNSETTAGSGRLSGASP